MQQTNTEGVQDKTRLGGKGDLQGNVQKIEFCQYYQMVYTQIKIFPRHPDGLSNSGLKTKLIPD